MLSVYLKEINSFFSSLIGYVVIGVFLVIMGLIMWVFQATSLLNYEYASLDQLFDIAPMIFVFLIPAITMRSFAEEQQIGTIEMLTTRPISDLSIVLGKFFACLTLVVFALVPTLMYYYTVYQLGSPVGNLDTGAIIGSYIGLIFLGACFVAVGMFASSLAKDQVVAFVLATFLCFLMHWGFVFFSELPIFFGRNDLLIQKLGIDFHYSSISRGVVDSRDVLYFLSIITLFISLSLTSLDRRNW